MRKRIVENWSGTEFIKNLEKSMIKLEFAVFLHISFIFKAKIRSRWEKIKKKKHRKEEIEEI